MYAACRSGAFLPICRGGDIRNAAVFPRDKADRAVQRTEYHTACYPRLMHCHEVDSHCSVHARGGLQAHGACGRQGSHSRCGARIGRKIFSQELSLTANRKAHRHCRRCPVYLLRTHSTRASALGGKCQRHIPHDTRGCAHSSFRGSMAVGEDKPCRCTVHSRRGQGARSIPRRDKGFQDNARTKNSCRKAYADMPAADARRLSCRIHTAVRGILAPCLDMSQGGRILPHRDIHALTERGAQCRNSHSRSMSIRLY